MIWMTDDVLIEVDLNIGKSVDLPRATCPLEVGFNSGLEDEKREGLGDIIIRA